MHLTPDPECNTWPNFGSPQKPSLYCTIYIPSQSNKSSWLSQPERRRLISPLIYRCPTVLSTFFYYLWLGYLVFLRKASKMNYFGVWRRRWWSCLHSSACLTEPPIWHYVQRPFIFPLKEFIWTVVLFTPSHMLQTCFIC